MTERVTPPRVIVRDTGTPTGRGVFAAAPLREGEVVEESPVVLFALREHLPVEVRRRMFNWARLAGEADTGGVQALALGYGSLYNHANPANLRYEADVERELLRFVAVRPIEPDEELTINYNAEGGGPVSEGDAWFARMGVEPVVGP